MNIFVLDSHPGIAASYHNDIHCRKMILESAQIICTVKHIYGETAPYKPTHKHHPCTLWAARSFSNYIWLRELTYYLNEEYKYRFDKTVDHASYAAIRYVNAPVRLPDIGPTDFALAMPKVFQYKDCSAVECYRALYIHNKYSYTVGNKVKIMAKWTKRADPFWYNKSTLLPFDRYLMPRCIEKK